jgi:FlaA1/EpsC-like NDP-sugar epimerase
LPVDTTYHAAAYKHVPLMEQNVMQCIANNVFGTFNMAELAIAAKVKHFILISTDKAVNPTNFMGASKRLAEIICQTLPTQKTDTCFSIVRFGNVLGSSGSVVPLFKKQIEKGGPITVTHLDVTRYFMTIPEAAQLVIQAGSIAEGGDVFVLDMGEPIKIVDLAKRMVTLSGLRPILNGGKG